MRVVLTALLLVAACGSPAASPTPLGAITVEMRDFQVVMPDTLQAGSLTFVVKNSGAATHDLTIIKTDLPADKLPQENGKAKEDGKVAGTPMINPGQTVQLTVELKAGDYVFICNEPGHYALGMHIHVSVR